MPVPKLDFSNFCFRLKWILDPKKSKSIFKTSTEFSAISEVLLASETPEAIEVSVTAVEPVTTVDQVSRFKVIDNYFAAPTIKAANNAVTTSGNFKTVVIKDLQAFATHQGLHVDSPVINNFPLTMEDTLILHPVMDGKEKNKLKPLPLPLHEYICGLSVTGGSRPFKRILVPIIEVGYCSASVFGYQVPLLYKFSDLLSVEREHMVLLEITCVQGIFNIIVHDSKSCVTNGLVSGYPLKSYLTQHFTTEACARLANLFGISILKQMEPNISINSYGVQSITDDTESGYHTILMIQALLQKLTYEQVLRDFNNSIESFYNDIKEEDFYDEAAKKKVSGSKFKVQI